MQLVNYLDLFVGALINFMFYIIIVKYVFNIQISKKPALVFLLILLISVAITIINFYNRDMLKLLLTIPVVTIGLKYILNLDLSSALFYSLVSVLYMFIGEIVAFLVISLFNIDITRLYNVVLGGSIGALLTILGTIPFLFIHPLKALFQKMEIIFKNKDITFLFFVFVFSILAFSYKNLSNVDNSKNIIVNIIMVTVFSIIVYKLYNKTEKIKLFLQDYNKLLQYLEQYEIELEKKEKIVHDYKNQLIVINSYAQKNNRQLKEYIAEIMQEQKSISSSGLNKKMYMLPKGLKGLFYYKFAKLDKSINVNVSVNSNLKQFQTLPAKITKDCLKVIGILLDNAIEASIESKDKNIDINFFTNNDKMTIILKNSCLFISDSNKIMQSGYSTKGKNRGYGLAIVDDIMKNIPQFETNIIQEKNTFEVIFSVSFK